MIDTEKCLQIGLLVENLDESIRQWSAFLGKQPDMVGETDGSDKSKAEYNGAVCYGRIRQAIYQLNGTQIELIQPIGDEPSFWKDCLTEKGPHIHHLAFGSNAIRQDMAELAAKGDGCVQYGEWGGGSGKYAYFDLRKSLNAVVELLDF